MARRCKHFECGHTGFGSYCRACQARQLQLEKARAARAQKAEAFAQDPIPLSHIGRSAAIEKAREVLSAIAAGAPYRAFGGKKLQCTDGRFLSVPIGWSYRLLYERTKKGLRPLEMLSHEDYNTGAPSRRLGGESRRLPSNRYIELNV